MTQPSLSLISINIEGNKHLDLVIPFLKARKPDVICFQEIVENDFNRFKQAWNMEGVYLERTHYLYEREASGVAILTSLPLQTFQTHIYATGRSEELQEIYNVGLVIASVVLENTIYHIATTHFTWSPGGTVTNEQRADLKELLEVLDTYNDIILCGDFNAPRGKEIFDTIGARYKDNIPSHVITTLDEQLHRAGRLDLVVDGFFTSPIYNVETIQFEFGVSDHCALVAKVIKQK